MKKKRLEFMKNKNFFSIDLKYIEKDHLELLFHVAKKFRSGTYFYVYRALCWGIMCITMEEYLYMFLPFVTNCYQQNIIPRILLDSVGHRSWKMTDHLHIQKKNLCIMSLKIWGFDRKTEMNNYSTGMNIIYMFEPQ